MTHGRTSPAQHGAVAISVLKAPGYPERETLELAAAGAAQVLGPDHGVTKALARASITMGKIDLWRAKQAIKTLRRDQREAIAEVG